MNPLNIDYDYHVDPNIRALQETPSFMPISGTGILDLRNLVPLWKRFQVP